MPAHPNVTGRRSLGGSVHVGVNFLCERFGVVAMTINRWLKDPELNFPQPYFIQNRRYWTLAEIERWERERAAASVRIRRHIPDIDRLRQEVASASSRADAKALIADVIFDHLPREERESAMVELVDLINELPESPA